MIWGYFGNNKVGDFVQVSGIMDKHAYKTIFEDHAIPSGKHLIGRGFIFQQDNDPKHTSKLCKEFLEQRFRRRRLNIMEWPPQSPDLNPIELLWDHLDREIRKTCPTSAKDLLNHLRIAWENIQEDTLDK